MRYCLIILLVLLCFVGLAFVVPDDAEAHKSSYRGHGCNGFWKRTCLVHQSTQSKWVTNDGGMWIKIHKHEYRHMNVYFKLLHYRTVRAPVCAKAHPCG